MVALRLISLEVWAELNRGVRSRVRKTIDFGEWLEKEKQSKYGQITRERDSILDKLTRRMAFAENNLKTCRCGAVCGVRIEQFGVCGIIKQIAFRPASLSPCGHELRSSLDWRMARRMPEQTAAMLGNRLESSRIRVQSPASASKQRRVRSAPVSSGTPPPLREPSAKAALRN